MARYSDADKMKNAVMEYVNEYGEIIGMFITDFNIMLERCSADVIEKKEFEKYLQSEEKLLNSLTRENMRGEWIEPNGMLTILCLNCGFINNSAKWNFCPNCGADMRK